MLDTLEHEGVAILHSHLPSLSQSLSSNSIILTLSQSLYSVWCINETSLDIIESIEGSLDHKKTTLLTALHEAVSTDHRKLKVIAQTLFTYDNELKEIAQILLQDNSECSNKCLYLLEAFSIWYVYIMRVLYMFTMCMCVQ